MLRQLRYFQAVVRNNSFSEAAEECYISQSAISQQIQALEQELGFALLERKNRKFTLTPAGEHFYRKSLVLVADYERMCRQARNIAQSDEEVLRIGFLRSYSSSEFHQALAAFAQQRPEVSVQIEYGNHEELYHMLVNGRIDMVLNDQRRKFVEDYVNLILTTVHSCVEISVHSPLASLAQITLEELKNIPCILVTSEEQRETEQEYYYNIVGFQGEYLYAENLETARLSVISGKGFMPVEGTGRAASFTASITRIPLYRNGEQITRNYCLFWSKANTKRSIEEFAALLKAQFEE